MPKVTLDSEMTPEQRRRAVAVILARGVLRYHRRISRLESGQPKNSPESSPDGLEVFGETRLSVSQCSAG
jgi:hypothetical protein